jgi:hypothetical protein
MRRNMMIVVCLVLLTMSLPTAARAGEVSHFRGQAGQARFTSSDGCIQTNVEVFIIDNTFPKPPADSGWEAAVAIRQSDFCTGTQLMDAFGTLAEQDFLVKGNLEYATLNTAINVSDSVSGFSFEVIVDLTWTGTGDLSSSNEHFHMVFPDFIVNGHFKGTGRPAEVSGSVSDGTTNFTPAPSLFAEFGSFKSGTVQIAKKP